MHQSIKDYQANAAIPAVQVIVNPLGYQMNSPNHKIGPDVFSYHEAMDRANQVSEILSAMFDGHSVVEYEPKVKDAYDNAVTALNHLYSVTAEVSFAEYPDTLKVKSLPDFNELSKEAKLVAINMIKHCIEGGRCMGQDEGLNSRGRPRSFRQQIMQFADDYEAALEREK